MRMDRLNCWSLTIVGLLLAASVAAGTYTVTIPIAKDVSLEGARLLANQRAEPGAPFDTVQAYLQHHCGALADRLVADWVRGPHPDAERERRIRAFTAAYDALIPEQRAGACTQIGVLPGDCPVALGP